MTSVRSMSEILMEESDISPAERERFVSIIHDESVRLTRLLDELLDINRLEAGTLNLRLEPIDPNAAVASALNAVSGITRNAGVAVEFERMPDELRIGANADRLRQVLINILSNAVKYNPSPDPKIVVRTNAEGRNVTIDVIDNGGGVTREDASMIFEKFARGSRADLNQGAGLGLAISRAIMRRMNGDLTVEFAPDETSFFRLKLRRSDDASPKSPELAPAEGSSYVS